MSKAWIVWRQSRPKANHHIDDVPPPVMVAACATREAAEARVSRMIEHNKKQGARAVQTSEVSWEIRPPAKLAGGFFGHEPVAVHISEVSAIGWAEVPA